MEKYDIYTCEKSDIRYPRGMKELSNMPSLLYYKGNIEIVNQYKNVAVIGSRKASKEGLVFAYDTGKIAAELGINVVNGLALGCDTEALRGALSVGGKCIALMPCGLDRIQPSSNSRLAYDILESGGCLISQYPPGTDVQKYYYIERDRLQSAISQGVLLVEAQMKSGTMHTAEYAIRQYKRLACYWYRMVGMASGNQVLEEKGKASTIKTENGVRDFLVEIKGEGTFEQLSLELS